MCIEINFGFRTDDRNFSPVACMALNVVRNLDSFRKGVDAIGLAAGRNRIQLKQEFTLVGNRVDASRQKDEDRDDTQKSIAPETVVRRAHCQPNQHGHCRQHENEIVLTEVETWAYREKGEQNKQAYQRRVSTSARIPPKRRQADKGKNPEKCSWPENPRKGR